MTYNMLFSYKGKYAVAWEQDDTYTVALACDPGSRVEGIKSREEAERLADGLLHWVADVYDIIFRLEPIDGFNIDEATKEVEPLIYGP